MINERDGPAHCLSLLTNYKGDLIQSNKIQPCYKCACSLIFYKNHNFIETQCILGPIAYPSHLFR
jgi:hypothetical protein